MFAEVLKRFWEISEELTGVTFKFEHPKAIPASSEVVRGPLAV